MQQVVVISSSQFGSNSWRTSSHASFEEQASQGGATCDLVMQSHPAGRKEVRKGVSTRVLNFKQRSVAQALLCVVSCKGPSNTLVVWDKLKLFVNLFEETLPEDV